MSKRLTRQENKISIIICCLIILISVGGLHSQSSDTLFVGTADSIVVEARRLPAHSIRSPYKIDRLNRIDWQSARQQNSIAEPLNSIPGVVVFNSNNFAQDIRLSIRGFGSRSAFGIRGIKIFVDGLPESTPDGQGQVDNIDPGLIENSELLGGPASGIYGNASGGVLMLQTQDFRNKPFAEIAFSSGNYGFQRYQLQSGGKFGLYQWIAFFSRTTQTGFREHNRVENNLFYAKIKRAIGESADLKLTLNYLNSPLAEDPGGLTQAADMNVIFSAGEKVEQGKIGLSLTKDFSIQTGLKISGFYVFRDFGNRLPFETGGAVNLFRSFAGIGTQFTHYTELLNRPYFFNIGFEFEWQADKRKRYNNLQGKKGDLVFNQLEQFTSTGLFILQEWSPFTDTWFMTSLRLDKNKIRAKDKYFADGNDSDDLDFINLSPTFGLSHSLFKDVNVYINYSYNFETPTMSELSSNPDGSGGFNELIKSQSAYNFETGFKGKVEPALSFQTAFFYLELNNELVPYELQDNPGRLFYRNAGISIRKGIETSLQWKITNWLLGKISFTYSDFKYTDYQILGINYKGNRQPGIPENNLFGQILVNYSSNGTLFLEGNYYGEIYANDANSVKSDAFVKLNLRVNQDINIQNIKVTVFAGINNLFNQEYIDNLRINAFGDRYFEAGQPRNVFAGLKVFFDIF